MDDLLAMFDGDADDGQDSLQVSKVTGGAQRHYQDAKSEESGIACRIDKVRSMSMGLHFRTLSSTTIIGGQSGVTVNATIDNDFAAHFGNDGGATTLNAVSNPTRTKDQHRNRLIKPAVASIKVSPSPSRYEDGDDDMGAAHYCKRTNDSSTLTMCPYTKMRLSHASSSSQGMPLVQFNELTTQRDIIHPSILATMSETSLTAQSCRSTIALIMECSGSKLSRSNTAYAILTCGIITSTTANVGMSTMQGTTDMRQMLQQRSSQQQQQQLEIIPLLSIFLFGDAYTEYNTTLSTGQIILLSNVEYMSSQQNQSKYGGKGGGKSKTLQSFKVLCNTSIHIMGISLDYKMALSQQQQQKDKKKKKIPKLGTTSLNENTKTQKLSQITNNPYNTLFHKQQQQQHQWQQNQRVGLNFCTGGLPIPPSSSNMTSGLSKHAPMHMSKLNTENSAAASSIARNGNTIFKSSFNVPQSAQQQIGKKSSTNVVLHSLERNHTIGSLVSPCNRSAVMTDSRDPLLGLLRQPSSSRKTTKLTCREHVPNNSKVKDQNGHSFIQSHQDEHANPCRPNHPNSVTSQSNMNNEMTATAQRRSQLWRPQLQPKMLITTNHAQECDGAVYVPKPNSLFSNGINKPSSRAVGSKSHLDRIEEDKKEEEKRIRRALQQQRELALLMQEESVGQQQQLDQEKCKQSKPDMAKHSSKGKREGKHNIMSLVTPSSKTKMATISSMGKSLSSLLPTSQVGTNCLDSRNVTLLKQQHKRRQQQHVAQASTSTATQINSTSNDPLSLLFGNIDSSIDNMDGIIAAKSKYSGEVDATRYAKSLHVVQDLERKELADTRRKDRNGGGSSSATGASCDTVADESKIVVEYICATCQYRSRNIPKGCIRAGHKVHRKRRIDDDSGRRDGSDIGTRRSRLKMEKKIGDDCGHGLTLGSGLEWSGWKGS